ncbi:MULTISPECIES: hypothetical protein [unclassified Crossiella]|uniref:hypothetical protein n=1 Tax=unclassified Crossiella TaxID=2620835 RepID=UPI001FFF70D7|nr:MULTISPECIES: hypothetical protein [unclassified Crossiella]MCK2239403.1 hypothetical protein [Crossiella sp. S99.2]MCK2252098.1 hypothetical protein [Crossiella sp. S99.1]
MPFFLGPLGALRELPSPAPDKAPEATATRVGAVHRSLTGRPTIDRIAVRRTWVLSWPYLDPGSAAYLDALHLGLLDGPLWLIDPQRVNRLPVQAAATGTGLRSVQGFTATGGTLRWISQPSPLPLSGGLRWEAPPGGGQLTADTEVPALPGEPVTFSAYVSAEVAVRAVVAAYTASGAQLTLTEGTPITPGPTLRRTHVTALVPATAAYLRLGLLLPTGGPGGAVTTQAWQAEAAPQPTPWAPGGGSAVVALDSVTTAYPLPGLHGTTVTLWEV